jgi:hypothetical protein
LKVIESKEVEECLDGVIIKELLLDKPVREQFIHHIGSLGELDYFPHFPRPFYRIRKKGQFILKGVEGNRTCQVFFVNYSRETEETIHEYIGRYQG